MAPVSKFSESAVSFDPSRKSTMKLPVLLVVAVTATMTAAAEQQDSELSRAAAAQLQRLAPFRRSITESQPVAGTTKSKPETRPKESRNTRANADEQSLRIPIDLNELYRIFSDSFGAELNNVRDKRDKPVQLTPARMEALDKYADKIMQDERVQSYMQERIKRDGYGGGYGGYGGYGGGGGGSGSGGSGAFVTGLAGQLVGSVVGLSTTASKGSSSSSGQSPAPVYGPPAYHSYGKESFSIWDFKRAIMNTLIQAVKAIGGGVLALKGQLIKGSGFLVSTKGRIISSAGDAITGLGKSLAASAVVQPPPAPHPGYGGHVGYAYTAPAAHVIAHDTTYDGPPPATNAYHSTFGAASDDESIQPGLLIGKPSPSIDYHTEQLQPGHYDTDIQHAEHQLTEPVQIEEAEPPKPSYNIKDVVGSLAGTSNFYQPDNLKAPEIQSVEETPSIPGNTLQLQDHNQQDNYELYPPLGNGPSDDKTVQQPPKYGSPAVNFKNPDDFPPQKYEYTSAQNAYGPPPSKYGVPDSHPYNYPPLKHQIQAHGTPDIQIEISDHDITGFESGGYAQHRQPHPPGLHVVAMQGPLKIPILGPEHYKSAGGYGHMNSIPPIGKLHTRYRPDFEVQKSLEYELRKRRADSFRTHRT